MKTGWSASLYAQFEGERNRPILDLAAALAPLPDGPIFDLGCGPGNSTEILCNAYPDHAVAGMDSDPDMLTNAGKRLPEVAFEQGDLATWQSPEPAALFFANAVFHWLPDHLPILARLCDALLPGGSLAIQMPDNLAEPTHRAMAEIAENGPWAEAFRRQPMTRKDLPSPTDYHEALSRFGAVRVWRTTYVQKMASHKAITDFVSGAGLRPYLDRAGETDRGAFLAAYQQAIEAAYPPLSDGAVLMPMPRLFVTVTRSL